MSQPAVDLPRSGRADNNAYVGDQWIFRRRRPLVFFGSFCRIESSLAASHFLPVTSHLTLTSATSVLRFRLRTEYRSLHRSASAYRHPRNKPTRPDLLQKEPSGRDRQKRFVSGTSLKNPNRLVCYDDKLRSIRRSVGTCHLPSKIKRLQFR